MIANGRDRDRNDQRPLKPPDTGSAARRLLWAVLGALTYVAAKYVFGF